MTLAQQLRCGALPATAIRLVGRTYYTKYAYAELYTDGHAYAERYVNAYDPSTTLPMYCDTTPDLHAARHAYCGYHASVIGDRPFPTDLS